MCKTKSVWLQVACYMAIAFGIYFIWNLFSGTVGFLSIIDQSSVGDRIGVTMSVLTAVFGALIVISGVIVLIRKLPSYIRRIFASVLLFSLAIAVTTIVLHAIIFGLPVTAVDIIGSLYAIINLIVIIIALIMEDMTKYCKIIRSQNEY